MEWNTGYVLETKVYGVIGPRNGYVMGHLIVIIIIIIMIIIIRRRRRRRIVIIIIISLKGAIRDFYNLLTAPRTVSNT